MRGRPHDLPDGLRVAGDAYDAGFPQVDPRRFDGGDLFEIEDLDGRANAVEPATWEAARSRPRGGGGAPGGWASPGECRAAPEPPGAR